MNAMMMDDWGWGGIDRAFPSALLLRCSFSILNRISKGINST